jgi:hypothetical protein
MICRECGGRPPFRLFREYFRPFPLILRRYERAPRKKFVSLTRRDRGPRRPRHGTTAVRWRQRGAGGTCWRLGGRRRSLGAAALVARPLAGRPAAPRTFAAARRGADACLAARTAFPEWEACRARCAALQRRPAPSRAHFANAARCAVRPIGHCRPVATLRRLCRGRPRGAIALPSARRSALFGESAAWQAAGIVFRCAVAVCGRSMAQGFQAFPGEQ